MMFEKKIEEPILIVLDECRAVFYLNKGKSLACDPGAGIKAREEHYGFIITTNYIGRGETRTTYKTTEKISGITTINGRLCIYEEGKSKPWEFTYLGTLLKVARFSNNESDRKFLEEKYGLKNIDKESIDEINRRLIEPKEIELKK